MIISEISCAVFINSHKVSIFVGVTGLVAISGTHYALLTARCNQAQISVADVAEIFVSNSQNSH